MQVVAFALMMGSPPQLKSPLRMFQASGGRDAKQRHQVFQLCLLASSVTALGLQFRLAADGCSCSCCISTTSSLGELEVILLTKLITGCRLGGLHKLSGSTDNFVEVFSVSTRGLLFQTRDNTRMSRDDVRVKAQKWRATCFGSLHGCRITVWKIQTHLTRPCIDPVRVPETTTSNCFNSFLDSFLHLAPTCPRHRAK